MQVFAKIWQTPLNSTYVILQPYALRKKKSKYNESWAKRLSFNGMCYNHKRGVIQVFSSPWLVGLQIGARYFRSGWRFFWERRKFPETEGSRCRTLCDFVSGDYVIIIAARTIHESICGSAEKKWGFRSRSVNGARFPVNKIHSGRESMLRSSWGIYRNRPH